MNPLILNFRGNALGQLRRYDEAVEDYEEATQIFDADGEVPRTFCVLGAFLHLLLVRLCTISSSFDLF